MTNKFVLGTRATASQKDRKPGLMPLCIALAFACTLPLTGTYANPTGQQVVSGQVSFNRNGNLLTITNSPNSIINWQDFSIANNEVTRFVQQNSDSWVLNRILGQDPTRIFGALQSNGKVFLINPNGVLFGSGSTINTAGLVASSLNISDNDFQNGKFNFSGSSTAGSVINQGSITTPSGGKVYLIAPHVENNGIITTPGGDVVLAAGHQMQLVDSSNPDVQVVLSAPTDQAINLGQIIAQGSRVGIYGALVNQRGIINANSAIVGQDGKIVFKATDTTLLENGSVTTATGAGVGGTILALGNHVGLTGNASIDASGNNGGGTVLVGGDFHGSNAAIPNASRSFVGIDATIRADALQKGDGGKVVVWSNDGTRFYGNISARGGVNGGNGGNVETSGKAFLDFQGLADLRAPHGKAGTLLLDPNDISILTGGGLGASTANIGGNGPYTFDGGPTSAVVTVADLVLQLGLGSVTVSTSSGGGGSGNITVANAVNWSSANSLTLASDNNIAVNAPLNSSGTGAIALAATGGITTTAAISSTTGQIGLTAGGNIVVHSPITATGSAQVSLATTGGNITATSPISSGGGQIVLSAGGNIVTNSLTTSGTFVTFTSGGSFSTNGGTITGGTLTGSAHTGVGSTGNPISANVGNIFNVTNSTSGDIVINNAQGISDLYVTNSGGNVKISAAGPLSITFDSGSAQATGTMTLNATGPINLAGSVFAGGLATISSQADLTLSNGGDVSGLGVTLQSGSGGAYPITVSSGVTVNANYGGPGTLTMLAGDAITTTGATLQYTGLNQQPYLYNPLPSLAQCIANPTLAGCTSVLPSLATCINTPATPGCSVVLPTLAQCTAAPTTPGCSVVLPTLSQCIAAPTTAGCSAVLPTIAQCTSAPTTPGCSVVLPTLAQCISNPSAPGCSVVLPTLTQCISAPTTAGCSVVLPTLAQCIAAPSTAGCSVVLPTLAQCIAAPSTLGCSVVLPSLTQCIAAPTTPGCTVVLPTLTACIAAPTAAGCSVVLPTLTQCISAPSTPGCVVVLPTLSQCTTAPSTPGCTVVLPSLATCTSAPTTAGCTAVLPSLSQCISTPSQAGCSVVLPTLSQCLSTSTLPGCSVVLPTPQQCAADPGLPGCTITSPTVQTGSSQNQPVLDGINAPIILANSTIAQLDTTNQQPGSSNDKKNGGTSSGGTPSSDAKSNTPGKLYCN